MVGIEIKRRVALKALDETGHGLARIATLSAVDRDGDAYVPGAFGEQHAKVMPAHDYTQAPIGKARVYESGDEALAEFRLNLNTELGRQWHAALKFDLDAARSGGAPIQEWSFGFTVLDSAVESRGGERVRVLKRLKVHEVSPVVVAAGVGTGTLALKPRKERSPASAKSPEDLVRDVYRSLARQHLARLEAMRSRQPRPPA